MTCFWTAAIGYSLEEIQIDLNVIFRDQHSAFGVGKLVPKYTVVEDFRFQVLVWSYRAKVMLIESVKTASI